MHWKVSFIESFKIIRGSPYFQGYAEATEDEYMDTAHVSDYEDAFDFDNGFDDDYGEDVAHVDNYNYGKSSKKTSDHLASVNYDYDYDYGTNPKKTISNSPTYDYNYGTNPKKTISNSPNYDYLYNYGTNSKKTISNSPKDYDYLYNYGTNSLIMGRVPKIQTL